MENSDSRNDKNNCLLQDKENSDVSYNNDFKNISINHDTKKDNINNNPSSSEDYAQFTKTSTGVQRKDSLESRNFFERTFGKMDEGSLRGSIFVTICFVMGTGCFTMPYTFNKLAFFPAIISIIVVGIASFWTLNLLIISADIKEIHDYKRLVEEVIGKGWAKCLDYLIVIIQFLLIITFTVAAYQLIANAMYTFEFYKNNDNFEYFLNEGEASYFYVRALVLLPLGIFVILPLSLIKQMDKLKVFALIGIAILFYITVVLIVEAPTFISHNIDNNIPYNWWNSTLNGFNSDLLFFPAISNIYYSLNANFVCFPVYKQLKHHTYQRITKVFQRAVVTIVIFLTIIGVIGYLSMPVDTNILIIFRSPLEKTDKHWFLLIGKMLYVLSLVVTCANNFMVLRLALNKIIYNDTSDNEISNKRNYILTIPVILLIVFIAILYQKVSSYVSIVGGFLIVITQFVLPVWVYVKVNNYHKYHYKNVLSVGIAAILVLIGYLGGIISIINIFTK